MTKNNPALAAFRLLPGIALVIVSAMTNIVYTSCNESGVTDSTTTTVTGGTASREDIMKIIEGGWVNTEYGEALNRVHSPMFAAEAGRPVQEMMFVTANAKGDTVYNSTGRLSYLNGDRFDVVLSEKNGAVTMTMFEGAGYQTADPTYLTYKIANDDTMLCLVNPKYNDSTWFVHEFTTAPQKVGVAQNALEHYVNRNLFEGEWSAPDGSIVKFDAEGKVSGWAKWTWFSVEIDKYGSEIQPDVMSAYNDKMGATYVYAIDNNRLSIYEYDSSSDDGMWTRGKLVIELTKK